MDIPSKSKKYCSVPQCNNYISNKVSVHKFPSCKILQEKWKIALRIGKPISKYMCVCSEHFLPEDFSKSKPNPLKRHLKKYVVPSQKIPVTSHQHIIGKKRKSRKEIAAVDSSTSMDVDENFVHIESITTQPPTKRSSNTSYGKQRQPLLHINLNDDDETKSFEDKSTQTDFSEFQFLDVLDTDNKLHAFTGVDHSVFKSIEACCFNVAQYNTIQIDSLRLKILLVFIKLRLNLSFTCLAVLFNWTLSMCTRNFYNTLKLLATSLKESVYWPDPFEIRANLPKCFDKFKSTRVVLDCTEVAVQKCQCLKCRIKTYSHYKSTHTIKWLIGVTPSGFISYISPAYGGRASDKSIVVKENLIAKCNPHDSIMVDKGFMIERECEEMLVKLIRPPFLKKNTQLSKQSAEVTAEIARARVHVERTIQRIKTYRIVNHKIDWYLVPEVDSIMLVIGALVNLSPPVLADDKFHEQDLSVCNNTLLT